MKLFVTALLFLCTVSCAQLGASRSNRRSNRLTSFFSSCFGKAEEKALEKEVLEICLQKPSIRRTFAETREDGKKQLLEIIEDDSCLKDPSEDLKKELEKGPVKLREKQFTDGRKLLKDFLFILKDKFKWASCQAIFQCGGIGWDSELKVYTRDGQNCQKGQNCQEDRWEHQILTGEGKTSVKYIRRLRFDEGVTLTYDLRSRRTARGATSKAVGSDPRASGPKDATGESQPPATTSEAVGSHEPAWGPMDATHASQRTAKRATSKAVGSDPRASGPKDATGESQSPADRSRKPSQSPAERALPDIPFMDGMDDEKHITQ